MSQKKIHNKGENLNKVYRTSKLLVRLVNLSWLKWTVCALFICWYEELHLVVGLYLLTRQFHILQTKRQEKRLATLFIGNASHAIKQRRGFTIALSTACSTHVIYSTGSNTSRYIGTGQVAVATSGPPGLLDYRLSQKWSIFVHSELDIWPLDLKFVLLVTLVQRYVFTKLKVSTTFVFPENQRHDLDGRGATINAAPYTGPHQQQCLMIMQLIAFTGATTGKVVNRPGMKLPCSFRAVSAWKQLDSGQLSSGKGSTRRSKMH